MTPSSGLTVCWEQSWGSGQHYISWLIVKDAAQEQPDGRGTQARSGQARSTLLSGHGTSQHLKVSISWEVGVVELEVPPDHWSSW